MTSVSYDVTFSFHQSLQHPPGSSQSP